MLYLWPGGFWHVKRNEASITSIRWFSIIREFEIHALSFLIAEFKVCMKEVKGNRTQSNLKLFSSSSYGTTGWRKEESGKRERERTKNGVRYLYLAFQHWQGTMSLFPWAKVLGTILKTLYTLETHMYFWISLIRINVQLSTKDILEV